MAELDAELQARKLERELHETIGIAAREIMVLKGESYLDIPTESLGRILMNLYSKEDPPLVK